MALSESTEKAQDVLKEYELKKGSFNKDTKAFRDTCKDLGIKHTYKSINEYILDNDLLKLK